MEVQQLPRAIRDAAGVQTHTYEEVVAHIAEKYELIDYNGRKVYLFGQGREFGDHRHIVAFHVRRKRPTKCEGSDLQNAKDITCSMRC